MFTVEESDTQIDPPQPYNRKTKRREPPQDGEREIIAWDMEGISLSGQHSPQHPVLFGCSIDADNALESEKLSTRDMLEYIMSIGEQHPHAIHVAFAFNYDANMIVANLTTRTLLSLWKKGTATFHIDGQQWRIKWIPTKFFQLTKQWGKKNSRAKRTVTIFDYSSFFGGKSFIKTCEQILKDDINQDDRETIEHGKAVRGEQSWEDMPQIRYYWRREIQLIERVFRKFRDIMCKAGFPLKQWYGPGALANFINDYFDMDTHLKGAQTHHKDGERMPNAVHEASKHAFSGGRFELFKVGYIDTRVYSVDINSAYPYALTLIPSLADGRGEWRHVESPDTIERFGFYRISYTSPNHSPMAHTPQPLFHRDERGMITYPSVVHGWYASPEAAIAQHVNGATIHEGWYWHTFDSEQREYPWSFLNDMYDTRKRLGKDNLMSMPFKLGPNSLYGKYAQTKGWNEDTGAPPKWHALPVAAWITSYTRAMLYNVMAQVPPDKLVSVETDSVFMTCDPRELSLSIGEKLGQWDVSEYDAMMITQNGMYHTYKDGEWSGTKSRGMGSTEYTPDVVRDYLQQCQPDGEWPSLSLWTKPRFMGLGIALQTKEPTKVIHTSWRAQQKQLRLGDAGKRKHVPKLCAACQAGYNAYDMPHSLVVFSRSNGDVMSAQRRLPWEQQQTDEVQEIRDNLTVESSVLETA